MTFREKILLTLLVLTLIFIPLTMIEVDKKVDLYVDQVITLDGGTYDTEVNIIITKDIKKALEFITEHVDYPVNSEDFDGAGITYTDEEGRIAIWLDGVEDRGVISHELLHATISIMSWAEIPLDENTEESYTYELQYLTNQFYNKLNQTK